MKMRDTKPDFSEPAGAAGERAEALADGDEPPRSEGARPFLDGSHVPLGRGAACVDLAFIIMAVFGLCLVPRVVALLWHRPSLDADPLVAMTLSAALNLAFVSLLMLGLSRARRVAFDSTGLWRGDMVGQLTRAVYALLCIYGVVIAQVGVTLLWAPVAEQSPRAVGQPGANPAMALGGAESMNVITLMLAMSAAAEELLFRGLLLRYTTYATRDAWTGILASALLFSVFHLPTGPGGALTAMWMALVLGAFYARYGSLLTVTTAHFLFNWLGVVLMRAPG